MKTLRIVGSGWELGYTMRFGPGSLEKLINSGDTWTVELGEKGNG